MAGLYRPATTKNESWSLWHGTLVSRGDFHINNPMRIPFDDTTASGLRCSVTCSVVVPGEQDLQPCEATGEMLLRRSGPGRVLVTGTVRADMSVRCDRCLEPFVLPVREQVSVVCELTGPGDVAAKEKKLDSGDLDTFFVLEPIVSLDEICRDQLLLAAYGKNICADTCKGLCPICGVNRNSEPCVCHLKKTASPFAVLAAHKKQKRH